MAVYIGGKKRRPHIEGAAQKTNIYSPDPITNGIMLVTSDGYTLRDSSRSYLTPEPPLDLEDELMSSDERILRDANGLYLISYLPLTFGGDPLLSSEGDLLKDKHSLYLVVEKGE